MEANRIEQPPTGGLPPELLQHEIPEVSEEEREERRRRFEAQQRQTEESIAMLKEALDKPSQEQEEVAPINTTVKAAYELIDFLQSEDRKGTSLMELPDEKMWEILAKSDELRRLSRTKEGGLYPEASIASVDATLEILHEFFDKERLFSTSSHMKRLLNMLRLRTQKQHVRAEKITPLKNWSMKALSESDRIVKQLQASRDQLTEEQRNILDSEIAAIEDIKLVLSSF